MLAVKLLLVLLSTATTWAAYTLNVRVHSYNNPTNGCPGCSNSCCDKFEPAQPCVGADRCDNTFYYCLRALGTRSPLDPTNPQRCGELDRFAMLSTANQDGDDIDFSGSHVLGLPNPIPLRGPTFRWEGTQLYIEVSDADILSSDEFIDRFEIDVERIPIGIETAPMQYNGSFGFAHLTLSFKVECFISHYFPDCEPNACERRGNCACYPGYTGAECDINIDDCHADACPENSTCVDGVNSFTCRCLEDYSGKNCNPMDANNNCIGVDCGEKGRCLDDRNGYVCICESGYMGEHCETQISETQISTSGSPIMEEPESTLHVHVILCIVAVIVVTLIVGVITTAQFTLIHRKNNSFLKLLREHIEDRMTRTTHNGSYNATAEKEETFLPHRKFYPIPHQPDIESVSNSEIYHSNDDIIITTSSDGEDDKIHESNAMTPNHAYNQHFMEGSHNFTQNRYGQQSVRPTTEPVKYISTFKSAHQARRPRNFKKINFFERPPLPPRPDESNLDLSSIDSTQETVTTTNKGGVQGSLEREDDDFIQTEHNPGYNASVEHREHLTPRTHTHFTSAPTPESEAFISVWTNKPKRVESLPNLHHKDVSTEQEAKLDIYESYKPYIPPKHAKSGRDVQKESSTRDTNSTSGSIHPDDIKMEHNYGYNVPLEHSVLTPPSSSHSNSSAPTLESEAFISVWRHNNKLAKENESTSEVQDISSTQEPQRLNLTEASV